MSRAVVKKAIFINDAACTQALAAPNVVWSVFVYPDGYGKLMFNRQFVGGREALYRVNVRPRAQFSRNDRLRPSVLEAMPTSVAAESGSSVSQERSASPIPLDWRM